MVWRGEYFITTKKTISIKNMRNKKLNNNMNLGLKLIKYSISINYLVKDKKNSQTNSLMTMKIRSTTARSSNNISKINKKIKTM